MSNKRRFRDLLPSYSYMPLLLAFVVNLLAFYATRPLNSGWTHYDLSLSIDAQLPFVPAFIFFYVLAYLQWGLHYFFTAREDREFCYWIVAGDLIAKVIASLIFLLLPTAMVRPEVTGTDLWSRMVRIIYTLDTPDNLFPSIHALESWLCLRGALMMKKPGRWYRPVSLLVTLGVFASVLLIKQHVFVDLLGGIAVAELGLWLARRTKAGRLLDKLNARLRKVFSRIGEA